MIRLCQKSSTSPARCADEPGGLELYHDGMDEQSLTMFTFRGIATPYTRTTSLCPSPVPASLTNRNPTSPQLPRWKPSAYVRHYARIHPYPSMDMMVPRPLAMVALSVSANVAWSIQPPLDATPTSITCVNTNAHSLERSCLRQILDRACHSMAHHDVAVARLCESITWQSPPYVDAE
jgi:hypothetical protein